MANILDKKERVYDLRLTAYGRYLLSVGKYKASQYAFFDDNVIYDYQYCNISESQNSINERICRKKTGATTNGPSGERKIILLPTSSQFSTCLDKILLNSIQQ